MDGFLVFVVGGNPSAVGDCPGRIGSPPSDGSAPELAVGRWIDTSGGRTEPAGTGELGERAPTGAAPIGGRLTADLCGA